MIEIVDNLRMNLGGNRNPNGNIGNLCNRKGIPYLHESAGVNYLLKIGYKSEDIKITKSSPDIITTNDNKEWEVKTINSGCIIFTLMQYYTFNENTIILVYDKNYMENPIDIIIFKDILSGRYPKYRYLVRFELDISVALSIFKRKSNVDNNK